MKDIPPWGYLGVGPPRLLGTTGPVGVQVRQDQKGEGGGWPRLVLYSVRFLSSPITDSIPRWSSLLIHWRTRERSCINEVADQDATDEVFELKEHLGEVYDRIESLEPSAFTPEGQAGLDKLLNGIWEMYKSEPKQRGEQGKRGVYRRTIEGGVSLSVSPINPQIQVPSASASPSPSLLLVRKPFVCV